MDCIELLLTNMETCSKSNNPYPELSKHKKGETFVPPSILVVI